MQKKRFLSLLATLLALMMLLTSCAGLPQPALVTVLKSRVGKISDTVGNLTGKKQRLISGGASVFSLVHSAEATPEEIAATNAIGDAIFDKTGVRIAVRDDSTRAAAGEKEILVGKTARVLPRGVAETMNAANFFIGFNEKGNLFIRAENALMTRAAADYFITAYVSPAPAADYLSLPATLSYTAPTLPLLAENKTEYKIVRSASADEKTLALAALISDAIRTKTGVLVPVVSDAQPEGEKEILVGNTKRDASVAARKALSPTQYHLGTVGEQIVINAVNSLMLEKAASTFISTFIVPENPLSGENRQLPLPSCMSIWHSENVLFLANKGVSDYRIVYPAGAVEALLTAATSLQTTIFDITGVMLPMVPDSEGEIDNTLPEILVGNTNRTASTASEQRNFPVNYWEISTRGNKILVGAFFTQTLVAAVKGFENALYPLAENQNAGLASTEPTERILFLTDAYLASDTTLWAAAPPLEGCAEAAALSSNRYRMEKAGATQTDFDNYLERLRGEGFIKDEGNSSSATNVIYKTATAKVQVVYNTTSMLLRVTVTPIGKTTT